jgi:diaminopropionate ammonia-lyase
MTMTDYSYSGEDKIEQILWTSNEATRFFKKRGTSGASVAAFERGEIEAVRRFHSTIPGYGPTPLQRLDGLATEIGIGSIYVKDESFRFGLNAFKVLGASYAIARYLAGRLGIEPQKITYELMTSDETKNSLGDMTFVTTTDGNHGRGLAWIARVLGQKCIVFMPKGSSAARVRAIEAEGARVVVRNVNYDESVRMTADEASQNGWIVVQDTAWEGYADIPLWIMSGYGTAAGEALEQLQAASGEEGPTHVFVQAGVGSMAAAVLGFFRARFPESPPRVIVAEASSADCFYRSAVAGDGRPHATSGGLDTIMAGLACGEPNIIAYEILRDYASVFVSCPDYVAARGMRVLGSPILGDPQICSGESGAVTAGLLTFIARNKSLSALRVMLGLNEGSRILLFSTEGDTDPDRYRSIVWDGEIPTPQID